MWTNLRKLIILWSCLVLAVFFVIAPEFPQFLSPNGNQELNSLQIIELMSQNPIATLKYFQANVVLFLGAFLIPLVVLPANKSKQLPSA